MKKEHIINLYQKSEVVKSFDAERRKYLFQEYKHQTEVEFLKSAIKKISLPEVQVLDVACGTGRMLQGAFSAGKKVRYHGLDTSTKMTEELKKKAKKLGKTADVTIKMGDATKMPFKDNRFDVTFSFHLLWHIEPEEQEKVLKEMVRVTKSGGFIVFDVLNRDFIWEKVKYLFGKGKENGLHKLNLNEVARFIQSTEDIKTKKLSDAPIKNSGLYKIFNFINKIEIFMPTKLYHMIYLRARKNV